MNPNQHSNNSLSNITLVATVDSGTGRQIFPEIVKSPEAALLVAHSLAITIVIYAIAKSIAIVITAWRGQK